MIELMKNNLFYESYVNDGNNYNTNIEIVLVELPIFYNKLKKVVDVRHNIYENMNDWFYHIEKMINTGARTIYLYDIETCPVMYDPMTFLPKRNFIIKEYYEY